MFQTNTVYIQLFGDFGTQENFECSKKILSLRVHKFLVKKCFQTTVIPTTGKIKIFCKQCPQLSRSCLIYHWFTVGVRFSSYR